MACCVHFVRIMRRAAEINSLEIKLFSENFVNRAHMDTVRGVCASVFVRVLLDLECKRQHSKNVFCHAIFVDILFYFSFAIAFTKDEIRCK